MTADNFALPAPGRSPVAAATARYVAVALALVVMLGGAVSLREAGIELGWVDGAPWIGAAITALNGLRSQWWMVPAGAVALILGLWLVVVAVRPRRKTVVAVDAAGSVWMRPRDVARLASHAASCVPGVEVLNSAATRRKVTMYVETPVWNPTPRRRAPSPPRWVARPKSLFPHRKSSFASVRAGLHEPAADRPRGSRGDSGRRGRRGVCGRRCGTVADACGACGSRTDQYGAGRAGHLVDVVAVGTGWGGRVAVDTRAGLAHRACAGPEGAGPARSRYQRAGIHHREPRRRCGGGGRRIGTGFECAVRQGKSDRRPRQFDSGIDRDHGTTGGAGRCHLRDRHHPCRHRPGHRGTSKTVAARAILQIAKAKRSA